MSTAAPHPTPVQNPEKDAPQVSTEGGQQPPETSTLEEKKECIPPPTAAEGGEATDTANANTEMGETAIGIDPCLPPQTGDGEEALVAGIEGLDTIEKQPFQPSVSATQTKKYRRHQFIKHEICIPDKTHRTKPVPKGKPWYLVNKKPTDKRHDSRIIFVMPKQEDPDVIALRKTNKMVQKLIKYMKKSWKVRVDRKQAERELEHRTLASVYTMKPDNWMDLIRAREGRALQTGFFSPMDVPYDALVDLELDTALLTFKNLPPDLKITAARWIRERLRKDERKRKRDAFLPRLPHGKVKRPSYNKGRLIKDPGGTFKVDQFVKVADGFQKMTRGNTPFSKALKAWSQKKETESHNMNSGFGVVREGMFDFSKKGRGGSRNASEPKKTAGEGEQEAEMKKMDNRRESIVDGRKYQRDMLYFEKMMGAIYDIMKSLLNIKTKQLESKFPLPPAAILQIRANSPDRVEKRRVIPEVVRQRNMVASRVGGFGGSHKSVTHARHSIEGDENEEIRRSAHHHPEPGPSPPKPNIDLRKSLADFGSKTARKSEFTLIQRLSRAGPDHLAKEDVINLSPVRSSTRLVDDIKKVHSYNDLMDVSQRKQLLSAEQKIKKLVEIPEHAAIRRARNYMTYTKLFDRHRKLKRPVWHHIDISAATDFEPSGLAGKDPAHLTEADAAEVVEMALMKRKNLEKQTDDDGTKRWPEEHDIPTPTFPFPRSKIRIPSEEQSRLNLLKKTPHIDTVPSTPVRRLYKLAGIRTTEKDIFTNIMDMKKMFRVTENKVRVFYENEVGKLDWDTLKRFRCKLNGIRSTPVYQWTISLMRLNQDQCLMEPSPSQAGGIEEDDREQKKLRQKRPALWYKKLQEIGDINGALRHNGCLVEFDKLLKYCDVDMKSRPHMINRLALLVVSLPTTELGSKHWQQAVVFLLEFMFGTPPQVIHQWLQYRGIPYLL